MMKLQLSELCAAFERFYVPSLLQKFALALACFLSFKLLLVSNISVIGRIYFIRTPGYESKPSHSLKEGKLHLPFYSVSTLEKLI